MYITRYTDYSLRVLIYLAAQKESDKLPTIQNIADAYQISKNHLMKIVQELNIKGYIVATRGKNGGLSLNKPPQQINVGRLVRELEQASSLVECFGGENQCVITPNCRLKIMLSEALNAFFVSLEAYTLLDLVDEKNQSNLQHIFLS